jgi:hypothetical protein
MTERRREPRTGLDFSLRVWGIDHDGRNFSQDVRARNVSISGALISQLDVEPRFDDLIGVEYGGKKARFRVVWVRNSGTAHKIQAAIHRVNGDECPWLALLPIEQTANRASAQPAAPVGTTTLPRPTPPTPS